MPLVESADDFKSEVASSKPRDEKGKFIKIPDIVPSKNIVENFLLSHTGNYKNQDDLLDIKIGNPLGRIVKLLEEIRRQKAFSFTFKGSLGVAGVILTLSVFGILGGGQMLCEKGTHTFIGTVKELKAREIYSKQIPVLSYFLELVAPSVKQVKNRSILIKSDNSTIYLPFSEKVDISKYSNQQVLATGNYNSCGQSLTISDPFDIEAMME